MRFHVLHGDSLAAEFSKTEINGEVIICRDAMIVGPVDAETPTEFWDARARFILAEYGEDEIVFHERVADELERLSETELHDEVNLWFEYELFCSVNMWFCLSILADSGAEMFRVEPSILNVEERWKGFGWLGPSDLQKCFDARQLLDLAAVRLGADLWEAYRKKDYKRLLKLSNAN